MKEFKEKIKKLKSTERGRSLYKIILDGIFLLIVILIIVAGNIAGKENSKKYDTSKYSESSESIESNFENKERTYLEKEELLKTGTYDFVYNISGSTKVEYRGKYSNGSVSGYKEDSSGIIRYSIENGAVYKLELDQKTPYNELYVGLDTNLFNYDFIFNTINSKSAIIDSKEEETTYTYDNVDGYKYIVKMNDQNITEITIQNDILTYDYKFTY